MGPRRTRTWLGLWLAVVVGLAVTGLVLSDDGADDAASPPPATGRTTSTSPAATVTTSSTTPSSTTPAPPPTAPSPTVVPTTPSTVVPATAVRRGPASRPVVALTFDAGSDAGNAGAILDTLAANGVPASFGLTGRWVEANPGLVRRMAAEGHLLVNHSYDHPSFTGYSTGAGALTRAQRLEQLARTESAVQAAAGVSTVPWFRPPYGDEDASVRADVAHAGYRWELMWTVDSLGWKGAPVDEVVSRCLDRAEPGAIYLFHVGAASTDHAALSRVIDGLRQRGYGFVTSAAMVPA
jgi:peptidoglycan-N-acetylglucosamine deacetylase